jgi:hypothetical protein
MYVLPLFYQNNPDCFRYYLIPLLVHVPYLHLHLRHNFWNWIFHDLKAPQTLSSHSFGYLCIQIKHQMREQEVERMFKIFLITHI